MIGYRSLHFLISPALHLGLPFSRAYCLFKSCKCFYQYGVLFGCAKMPGMYETKCKPMMNWIIMGPKFMCTSVTVFPGSDWSTSGCICVCKHTGWKWISLQYNIYLASDYHFKSMLFLRMEMQCLHIPTVRLMGNLKLDIIINDLPVAALKLGLLLNEDSACLGKSKCLKLFLIRVRSLYWSLYYNWNLYRTLYYSYGWVHDRQYDYGLSINALWHQQILFLSISLFPDHQWQLH